MTTFEKHLPRWCANSHFWIYFDSTVTLRIRKRAPTGLAFLSWSKKIGEYSKNWRTVQNSDLALDGQHVSLMGCCTDGASNSTVRKGWVIHSLITLSLQLEAIEDIVIPDSLRLEQWRNYNESQLLSRTFCQCAKCRRALPCEEGTTPWPGDGQLNSFCLESVWEMLFGTHSCVCRWVVLEYWHIGTATLADSGLCANSTKISIWLFALNRTLWREFPRV